MDNSVRREYGRSEKRRIWSDQLTDFGACPFGRSCDLLGVCTRHQTYRNSCQLFEAADQALAVDVNADPRLQAAKGSSAGAVEELPRKQRRPLRWEMLCCLVGLPAQVCREELRAQWARASELHSADMQTEGAWKKTTMSAVLPWHKPRPMLRHSCALSLRDITSRMAALRER